MSNYTQEKIRLATVWRQTGDDPWPSLKNFPWLGGIAPMLLGRIDARAEEEPRT